MGLLVEMISCISNEILIKVGLASSGEQERLKEETLTLLGVMKVPELDAILLMVPSLSVRMVVEPPSGLTKVSVEVVELQAVIDFEFLIMPWSWVSAKLPAFLTVLVVRIRLLLMMLMSMVLEIANIKRLKRPTMTISSINENPDFNAIVRAPAR